MRFNAEKSVQYFIFWQKTWRKNVRLIPAYFLSHILREFVAKNLVKAEFNGCTRWKTAV